MINHEKLWIWLIFGESNVYLHNLLRIVQIFGESNIFTKPIAKKVFNFVGFRLIKCIFMQPAEKKSWVLPIFGEANVYLCNQSLKKVRDLPRKCTQPIPKSCISKSQHLGGKNCWFLAYIYATNYQDHFIKCTLF